LGVILVVVVCVVFIPYVFDHYNQSDAKKLKDIHANDKRIYGEKGAPAKQLANKYTDTPEGAKKADAIRAKFFGGVETVVVAAVDTVKADAKKTEKKDSTKVK
jgi:hypothetical protein